MLANQFHINPNEDNKGREYGVQQAGVPHSNAIPPLDIQITILEIMVFFPAWMTIPDVAVRARRNGLGRKQLAKAELHGRNTVITKDTLKRAEDRIQKNISQGGNMFLGRPADGPWDSSLLEPLGRQNDLTANEWELRGSYTGNNRTTWGHVLLLPIAQSIPDGHWPKGLDRGLLTMCLEFVLKDIKPVNQGGSGFDRRFDTSHWHLIINSQNWTVPPDRPLLNGEVADPQAMHRANARVPDP